MKNQDPSQLNIPLNFVTLSDPATGATHTFDSSNLTFSEDDGKHGSISGMQLKDMMLFNLMRLQSNTAMKETLRAEAAEAYPILSGILTKIWIEYKPDGKSVDRFGIDIVDPKRVRFGSVATEDKDRAVKLGSLVGQMLDGIIPRDEALIDEYNSIDQESFEPESEEAHKLEVWQTVNHYMSTSAVHFALMVSIYPKKELVKIFKKPKASASRRAPKQKNEAGHYLKSGHLVDQVLKHFYPDSANSKTPSLFDRLQPATQEMIESVEEEHTTLVEGIRLTAMEQKIVDALCKLLHNKSTQTSDPKGEGYYLGNERGELRRYGSTGKRMIAPALAFSLYEIASEVYGNTTIGGSNVDAVTKALTELSNKRFLISYKATFKDAKGKTVDSVEWFDNLFTVRNGKRIRYDLNNVELYRNEQTIVDLNPIFVHQIDSKFVKTPSDIARRTIIAAGNTTNIPSSTLVLRDYLIRQHGTLVALRSKTFIHEVYVDNLQYTLCEEWLTGPRKRKLRAKEYTDRAISVSKRLGLIESVEVKPGATGNPKYVFTLNKEWK